MRRLNLPLLTRVFRQGALEWTRFAAAIGLAIYAVAEKGPTDAGHWYRVIAVIAACPAALWLPADRAHIVDSG